MLKQVLKFWFEDIPPSSWWKKDEKFDKEIRNRFLHVHEQASRCELFHWRASAEGRLAEIIVLDQFSRNIFRNTPEAFAYDFIALTLAQEAILRNIDKEVSEKQKSFIYLPFMHSESLLIHKEAVKLYEQPGMESSLEWEMKHMRIIERFGRYPHRNEILGRKSTEEEILFLQQPGSRF